MGDWTQSLALRTGDRNAVRQCLVDWMAAKGYVQNTTPRLFACDEENEYGFYLFGNPHWTVVLYNRKFDEFDRVIFELNKLNVPILFLFCFDSDEWGYHLIVEQKTIDEFCVRTFWLNWPIQTQNYAQTLCDTLKLEISSSKLAKIMRQRAVFSESVLHSFCDALGIAPAGIDFGDIETLASGMIDSRKVASFELEPLFFTRRNAFNPMYPLHSMTVRSESMASGFDMGIPIELEQWGGFVQAQVQLMRILMAPLIPLGFMIGMLFRVYFGIQTWIGRWMPQKELRMPGEADSLISELLAMNPCPQRTNGDDLINAARGCRITMPKNGAPAQHFAPFQVFGFTLDDAHFSCFPIRLQELRRSFVETAYSMIVKDESFFANGFPARLLIRESAANNTPNYQIESIVETPDCYYRFSIHSQSLAKEAATTMMKAIVLTFDTHVDQSSVQ